MKWRRSFSLSFLPELKKGIGSATFLCRQAQSLRYRSSMVVARQEFPPVLPCRRQAVLFLVQQVLLSWPQPWGLLAG